MEQHIIVQNISCGGCVSSIKKALSKIEGVENVHVEQNSQVVTVEGKVKKSLLTDKLAELGYPEKE